MGITRTLRVIGSAALTGALVFGSASPAAADRVRDGQWALKSLEAESIWKITKGEGQTVAVIGAEGVSAGHPDLKGSVLKGMNFGSTDSSTAPEKKDAYFGTAVAAIIAGHGHGPGGQQGVMGLAPEAEILPIKTTKNRGYEKTIRYAVDHGADVIYMSGTWEDSNGDENEVAYALKHDVVVVAATGDDGNSGTVAYPAAHPGVVAVTGIHEDGISWSEASRGREAMLSAPGVQIVTASNEAGRYKRGPSTLYGAGYVAASAALLKAKYPDLTAGQIVNRLTKTAAKVASGGSGEGRDAQYGFGAIRPLSALQEDIPKGPKYGPLALPKQIQAEIDDAKLSESAKVSNEQNDLKQVVYLSLIGIVILLFVGGVVTIILIVRSRRKSRLNGPGASGAQGSTSRFPTA